MKRRTSNRNRKKSLKARKNEEQEEDARAEFSLKRPKRKADEPLSATESVAHTAKKSRPPLSAPKTPTAAKAPAGIATPVAGAEVPNNHKGFRDPFRTAASELPETQVNQASKQAPSLHAPVSRHRPQHACLDPPASAQRPSQSPFDTNKLRAAVWSPANKDRRFRSPAPKVTPGFPETQVISDDAPAPPFIPRANPSTSDRNSSAAPSSRAVGRLASSAKALTSAPTHARTASARHTSQASSSGFEERFRGLEARIESILAAQSETCIPASIEKRLKAAETAIAQNKSSLLALHKKQDAYMKEFESSTRISKEKVSTLETDMEFVAGKLGDQIDNVNDHTKAIDALRAEFEAAASSKNDTGNLGKGGDREIGGARPQKKQERKNDLNRLVRRCFYKAMAIEEGCSGTKLLDLEKPGGGGWAVDHETGKEVLRPNFLNGFGENSIWHERMIEFICEHGNSLEPTFSPEELRQTPEKVIKDRLSVVFKGAANKTRQSDTIKGVVKDDGLPPDVRQRRAQRKQRKLADRKTYRLDAMGKDWDWFFQTVYMSTEESEYEAPDGIDSDSLDENPPNVKKKKKPSTSWTTYPPKYRCQDFANWIEKITDAVDEGKSKGKSNGKSRTVRNCGEPREKPLPKLYSSKPRIPRYALDPDWLYDHPEFCDTRYMTDIGTDSEDGYRASAEDRAKDYSGDRAAERDDHSSDQEESQYDLPVDYPYGEVDEAGPSQPQASSPARSESAGSTGFLYYEDSTQLRPVVQRALSLLSHEGSVDEEDFYASDRGEDAELQVRPKFIDETQEDVDARLPAIQTGSVEEGSDS